MGDRHIEEPQADGFTYVADLWDDGSRSERWVHGPFFITGYHAIKRSPVDGEWIFTPSYFMAYRASVPVPKGCQPWTVRNRRIHPEDLRIATLDEAKALVAEKLTQEAA